MNDEIEPLIPPKFNPEWERFKTCRCGCNCDLDEEECECVSIECDCPTTTVVEMINSILGVSEELSQKNKEVIFIFKEIPFNEINIYELRENKECLPKCQEKE